MKTKLVIFDNDGVLVDSESLIKQAQVAAFACCGAHITPEWSYKNLQGLRAADVVATVSRYTGVEVNAEVCLAQFKQIIWQLFKDQLKPVANINLPLAALRDNQVPVCMATSGPLAETYYKIELTGLASFFPQRVIFSGEQVPRGKPAPDLMLLAAKTMGIAPELCAVVEDAPFGIQAAKAAGMYAIGFLGAEHVRHTDGLDASALKAAGADVVVRDHAELMSVIP